MYLWVLYMLSRQNLSSRWTPQMSSFLSALCILSALLVGTFGVSENTQEVFRGGYGQLGCVLQ